MDFNNVIGGYSFIISGVLVNPMDALFESMSGITATGATVISDVDSIPKSFILCGFNAL